MDRRLKPNQNQEKKKDKQRQTSQPALLAFILIAKCTENRTKICLYERSVFQKMRLKNIKRFLNTLPEHTMFLKEEERNKVGKKFNIFR